MNRISLSEIEERARAATRGPWVSRVVEWPVSALGEKHQLLPVSIAGVETAWVDGQLKNPLSIAYVEVSPFYAPTHMVSINPENAEFIANAREDVPALVHMVQEMQRSIDLLTDTSILNQMKRGKQISVSELIVWLRAAARSIEKRHEQHPSDFDEVLTLGEWIEWAVEEI